MATDYRKRFHPEEKAKRAKERETKRQAKENAEGEFGAGQDIERGRELEAGQNAHAETPVELPEQNMAPTTSQVPRFFQRIPPQPRTPSQTMIHALIRQEGFRCSYTDPVTKKRCNSTYGLEIHHKKPWAKGGETELPNLAFLCKNHHARESFLEFGDRVQQKSLLSPVKGA